MLVAISVAGCSGELSSWLGRAPDKIQTDSAQRPAARPKTLEVVRTTAPKPRQTAQTAEQFDTTTKEQRIAAVKAAAPTQGEHKLGQTVGSLGNPAEPGLWMKTPLVSKPTKGRVEYPAADKSVTVDLIPIDGPKTAGSRVSLAAMRLLGAPLTGLPDLIVYAE